MKIQIKKSYVFAIVFLMLIALISSVCQYMNIMKTEDVSAVTVGTPNPGHTWSSMECSADSLCIDPAGNKLGIGTNTPSQKLEVNGNIKLGGASPSYTVSNVVAPVASSDVATKAYVDASSGPSCRSNYANLCANGGGLAFTYDGATEYIDAYPRASAWYTSGSPSGQALAWQMCGAIGARLATLAEWQAACTALGGPTGNGRTTFGGQNNTTRWEWVADPSSAGSSQAVLAGAGSCAGTLAAGVKGSNSDGDWFRCVR